MGGSVVMKVLGLLVLYGLLMFPGSEATPAWTKPRRYDFIIQEVNYTRLCSTKSILTVNGHYPGPTIRARQGDIVYVRVRNHAQYNITIHWHGIDQPRNPWSDGPEYITQCPIQPGGHMTYRIEITEEIGTLWWHAHSEWDRNTLHGAIIIHPKKGESFPFPQPHKEVPIILGQWWKSKIRDVVADALRTGAPANLSDAYTINGQPGDMYNCSKPETFKLQVEHGKTYMLRVINAAMNNEFFFAVAGHKLTVVGSDAAYTKPYTVDYVMIVPGQTMSILLHADALPSNRYYMAARVYWSLGNVPFDPSITTGVVEYVTPYNAGGRKGYLPPSPPSYEKTPILPFLPDPHDTAAATAFTNGVRSLNSKDHPSDVPQTVDERIIITTSVNLLPCGNNATEGPCVGPFAPSRLSASLNNITFATPDISVLQAYYNNMNGIVGTNFPNEPPFKFNYTGDNSTSLSFPRRATEVKVLEYNKNIEIVFQGTALVVAENHPLHLHGHSFYVVGSGFGNFDETKDPMNYNLVDPPYQNTVGVPVKGWSAVRFRTLNPGVWFMHCHIDLHVTWGMMTAFIVKNGPTPQTSVLPPPPDMPRC